MPVRSLRSSVLKWPDAAAVREAFACWAEAIGRSDPNVLAVGYFGSYARGNAGVGSDLDIVLVVRDSDQPFQRRPLAYDATRLPVPADVLVYTQKEWDRLSNEGGRFARMLQRDTLWVWRRGASCGTDIWPRFAR